MLVGHFLVITAGLSCTHLAHHELESLFIIIIIIFFVIVIIIITISIIIIIIIIIAGGDYVGVGRLHSGRIYFWLHHHAHWGPHGRHRHRAQH